jgi:multidrug efflux pump subunit AcrA (membrane-fusion protein)
MGNVTQTVDASGTLQPDKQFNLDFGSNGRVTSVNVAPGQQVKQGDVLASLDTQALQAQQTKANASLTAAQTKLSDDQSKSASQTTITSDQASIDSAAADLQSTQDSLNGAKIVSPIDGVVGAVNVTQGQVGTSGAGSSSQGGQSGGSSSGSSSGSQGSGGSQSSSGSQSQSSSSSASSTPSSAGHAIVVMSNGPYQVSTSVTDAQIAQIKLGQKVRVTPAGASAPVDGTVTQISPLATSSQNVATYPVIVSVDGTPQGLFAGASAQVSIVSNQAQGVVTVPTAAVHTNGSRSFVEILQNGRPVRQRVSTGIGDPIRTQITDGLGAGTPVVLADLGAAVPSSNEQNRGFGFAGGRGGSSGGGGSRGGGFGG